MATPRILVIDDDEYILTVTTACLERTGFEVVPCHSVHAGIHELSSESFDLVVTDYSLPDGDGSTIVHAVSVLSPTTPVLIMTGNAGEVSEACFSAGVFAQILWKPFSPTTIAAYANNAIAYRSKKQSA